MTKEKNILSRRGNDKDPRQSLFGAFKNSKDRQRYWHTRYHPVNLLECMHPTPCDGPWVVLLFIIINNAAMNIFG